MELIELLMSKEYPGQNRGFAFVEFHNHACAQAAKNTLSAPAYTCAHALPGPACLHAMHAIAV